MFRRFLRHKVNRDKGLLLIFPKHPLFPRLLRGTFVGNVMIGIFPDLLVDPVRTRSSQIYHLHDWRSTTIRASVRHFLIRLSDPRSLAFIRGWYCLLAQRTIKALWWVVVFGLTQPTGLNDPRSLAFIRGCSSPGRCCSCLSIDPANGLQIRYDHGDQLFRFQHLALGPPVHDPAIDQAEVIDVEAEDQGALGLRFEDLAGMPLILADDSGIGPGESQHDVVISVAPDRAQGLRHVIPGPEAGRAEEARARLHHRTHPLDLEQPDVAPQVAMTNQAPVVVGSKYQVVGIDGPPLRLVPSRSPVDHAQLPRLTHGRHQNPKNLRIVRRLNAGQDRQATGQRVEGDLDRGGETPRKLGQGPLEIVDCGFWNAECGMRNGEKADGKCRMADAGWRMADGKCRMADGKCSDRKGRPRFLGAQKWVAPSAPRLSGGERGGKF